MITLSASQIVYILFGAICTFICSMVLVKYQQGRKAADKERENRVTAEVCERELILSMAGAIEVILRKSDGENTNGEMKKARAELEDKKRALEKLTNVMYFNETV